MELHVLRQTQEDRDNELARYLNITVQKIKSIEIASPDTIRIASSKQDVLVNGVLDNDKVKDLYIKLPYLNTMGYFKTLMYTSVNRRPKQLFDFLNQLSSTSTLLDYGCGVGSHSLIAAYKKVVVTYLDLDSPILDFAQWRFNLRKLQGSKMTPDTLTGQYSHAICIEALEHIVNPVEVLNNIIETLVTGGKLFLVVSNRIKDTSGHFEEIIKDYTKNSTKILKNLNRVSNYVWEKK